jgi:hypothetical protein
MCCYQLKKPFIIVCLLAACIGCFIPHAHAQFEYDISPILRLQEQYDDNINLTRSFKKIDLISTISPGFSLLLSHPRVKLTCKYLHDFAYFKNYPQFDYQGHNLNMGVETRITEYLRFLFTENYIRSNNPEFTQLAGPIVQPGAQQTVIGFRRPYNQNSLSPQLEYRFGAEDLVKLTYSNTRYSQKGPGSDDYTDNFYDGMITYWLNENNGINLQYSRDKGNFQVQDDFESDRIAPRLIYRFSRQTEVFADYSYTGTDFNQKADPNPDYFVNDFDAGFKMSPLSTVKVEGKLGYYWRHGHEKTDNQGFIYRLWGEKRFSSGTIFMDYRGGYTENFFGLRDSGFYEFWGISTGFTYNYENILTFKADGSFANDDYITTPIDRLQGIARRKDDVWRGNILIGYRITPFLTFELEYNYVDQASNRNTDYFIDNRITGRLVINFQKDYQKGSNGRNQ